MTTGAAMTRAAPRAPHMMTRAPLLGATTALTILRSPRFGATTVLTMPRAPRFGAISQICGAMHHKS